MKGGMPKHRWGGVRYIGTITSTGHWIAEAEAIQSHRDQDFLWFASISPLCIPSFIATESGKPTGM